MSSKIALRPSIGAAAAPGRGGRAAAPEEAIGAGAAPQARSRTARGAADDPVLTRMIKPDRYLRDFVGP